MYAYDLSNLVEDIKHFLRYRNLRIYLTFIVDDIIIVKIGCVAIVFSLFLESEM